MTFDEFWHAYPRKVGKGAAIKSWARAIKLAPPYEIMAGLTEAQNEWVARETETQFIPHPSTWLNQRRWEDEHPEIPTEREWYERDQLEEQVQTAKRNIPKPRVQRIPILGKLGPQGRQAIIDRMAAMEPEKPNRQKIEPRYVPMSDVARERLAEKGLPVPERKGEV